MSSHFVSLHLRLNMSSPWETCYGKQQVSLIHWDYWHLSYCTSQTVDARSMDRSSRVRWRVTRKQSERNGLRKLPSLTIFVFPGVRIDKAVRDVTTFIHSAVPPKKPMSPQHTPDIVSSHLVASETRLAPLKAMSIPRLELMGELMGFTMKRQICSALQVPMNKATFWVDSANVGLWIQGQSRKYKPCRAFRRWARSRDEFQILTNR